jgi:branched-chain amino acid transport system ATP-binding protein
MAGQEVQLEISNMDVFHGTFQALWNVSLEVKRGEMVALIGANTSGKSTLMDAVSGLLHPANGTIKFEGTDISRMDCHEIVELGITQVPEGRCVFPEMTVQDNLMIGSYAARSRSKAKSNLESIYNLFPILRERRKQIAKTLSGGEQQMLVIGRGLMSEPKLILIDEMSLGLAPIVIEYLFNAIKKIKETGVTILFVKRPTGPISWKPAG